MNKRRLLTLIAVISFLTMFPSTAWACNCAKAPIPDMGFRNADAVFTGTAAGTTDWMNSAVAQELVRLWMFLGGKPPTEYKPTTTFQVLDSWKGVTTQRVTIETDRSSCGYEFRRGGEYLIYAQRRPETLSTNICFRTTDIAFASEDLAYLRPLPKLALASSVSPLFLVAVFTSAATLLACAWFARRKLAAKLSASDSAS